MVASAQLDLLGGTNADYKHFMQFMESRNNFPFASKELGGIKKLLYTIGFEDLHLPDTRSNLRQNYDCFLFSFRKTQTLLMVLPLAQLSQAQVKR